MLAFKDLAIAHFPLSMHLSFRYGLYGSPFDPVLFDLEMSGSSCKNTFNSSIGVQSDEIDLSDILSGAFIHSSLTDFYDQTIRTLSQIS